MSRLSAIVAGIFLDIKENNCKSSQNINDSHKRNHSVETLEMDLSHQRRQSLQKWIKSEL